MANLNTQIANELMELTSQLPRVQAAMTIEVRKMLQQFQKDMIVEVAKFDIMGVSARRYQQKRALALIKSVKALTTETYRNIHKLTQAELVDLAGVSANSFLNVVNGVAGGELLTHTLSSPQLRQLVKASVIDGATSAQWWGKQASNTQFKFSAAVQDAMLKGEGTDTIVRSIRGTKALNYTDGFMNTAYNNARALVHSSVQSVANDSRLAMIDENNDVIEGVEWLATLDGHTTQICKALDGLVWDNERKPVGHSQNWPGSTAHWQERSTQVPVLKGFSKLPKRKQAEFKGERVSMDGEVSASVDYDEWLKKKDKVSPKFVSETLGPEKYAIWKKKGLSMLDMVDQHNNPLTVKQLTEKFV